MKNETKFKIKTFLQYLIFEPLNSKNSLPNFKTISWIMIFVSVLLKNIYLQISFVIIGFLIYLITEYKSGNYIGWYRMKKYKNFKEAIKNKRTNTQLNIEINEEGKGSGEISPDPNPNV
jgi:hypothetical protein